MTQEGDIIEVQLVRVVKNGRSVGFSDQGDIIFVEGVEGGDSVIQVRISDIRTETMSGTAIPHQKKERSNRKSDKVIEDPYDFDDEDQNEEIEG